MTDAAARIAALEAELAVRDAELDRVKAAAAATEDRLRRMLDAIPVGVAVISLKAVVEEANDLYLGLLPGATRENTIGRSVVERVQTVAAGRIDPITGEKLSVEERQAWVEARLAQYRDPKLAPAAAEYVLPSGVILRTTNKRASNGSLVQITQDIAEIRRDEQRLRGAIEMLPAAISFFDDDKRLIAFNEHFVGHLRPDLRDQCRIGKGYVEMAKLLLRSVETFDQGTFGGEAYSNMSDEEIEALATKRTQLVDANTEPVMAEYKMWDGRIFRSRTVRTPGFGIVRVAVDVTFERQMTQRFADVVASLDDAVFLFDEELHLRLWSPSVARMFPFLAESLVEGAEATLIRGAIRSAAIESDRYDVTGIVARTYVRRFLDGRTIQVRCLPTREGGLLVVCSDQTTLQKANLLASRAERMESLGRLVAGVAHEINTPLGIAITTSSSFGDETRSILAKFKADQLRRSELEEFLAISSEACGLLTRNLQRAGELVSSFKRVSVDELSGDYRSFDLARIIEDAASMLRPQLRVRGHELRIDCPSDLTMTSYPSAFTQIITNFVMNSVIHAYPEGFSGVMRLTVARVEAGVEIRYSDDGVGVPADILGRIFEHFFTTRRGQGGSGLGLGIVHNLVTHQLAGTIEASSPPGSGLEIRLVVPAVVERSASGQSWV